jgi:hypothetical protein
LRSHHLSNALHLQSSTEFRDLILKHNPSTLKVVAEFDAYIVWFDREDQTYKIILKSEISQEKEVVDHERDQLYIGMNRFVNASLTHFEQEKIKSAKRLKILFDSYNQPQKLTAMPYDAETTALTNFIQELNGVYSEDVHILELNRWVDMLDAKNREFEDLAKKYNEELSVRRPEFRMRDVRHEVDKARRVITDRINALIIVEGEATYSAFVREWNELVKHYNDILAQHKGRNKAKKVEN